MNSVVKSVMLAATLGVAGSLGLAQDWEGPYAGVFGAYTPSPSLGAIGAWAGYSFPLGDNAYAGVEGDGLYFPTLDRFIASGSGRLAYAVSPDVLIHGKLGLAVNDLGAVGWLAGAGGQVAVGSGWSLRGDVDRYQTFGTGAVTWIAKGGAVYDF